MAGDDKPGGFEIPVHQSLLEPVTIKGVARIPAILIGTVGALLVFSLHKVTGGILLTVALWAVAKHVTEMDAHMFDFIVRRARSRLPFLGG
jgi:type IV secretory pathway TrbD component